MSSWPANSRQLVHNRAVAELAAACRQPLAGSRRRRRLRRLLAVNALFLFPTHPAGDDLLAAVLSHLGPADLAAAEGVCRRWRAVAGAHRLWRRHAAEAWPAAAVPAHGGLDKPSSHDLWKQRYLQDKWQRVWTAPGAYTRKLRLEQGAHAAVTALSASPCGRRLASAAADGSLALWDVGAPGAGAPLRPRLLCRAQHPRGEAVLWARLLAPDTAASATATALFLWRAEPSSSGSGSSSAVGGASVGGAGVQLAFRLLRRIAVEGSRVACAAAWGDQFLAAGCGELG